MRLRALVRPVRPRPSEAGGEERRQKEEGRLSGAARPALGARPSVWAQGEAVFCSIGQRMHQLNCVRSSFSSPPFLRRQAGGAQTRLARRQPHSSPCATTHRRLLVGRRGRLRDSYLPICHALTSPFLPTRSSSRRTRLGVGRCKWCLRPCHHRPCSAAHPLASPFTLGTVSSLPCQLLSPSPLASEAR